MSLDLSCLAATPCCRLDRACTHAYPGRGSTPLQPATALIPTQSGPEVTRRALYTKLQNGWGTYYHPSMLTWVLLPESFAVKVGLYRLSTGALLSPEGLTANAFTMYPRLGRGYALDSLFFFLSFCPSAGIPSLQTVCPSACVLLLTRLAFHRAHRSGIGGAIHGFSQAPVRHSGRPALV